METTYISEEDMIRDRHALFRRVHDGEDIVIDRGGCLIALERVPATETRSAGIALVYRPKPQEN